MSFKGSRQTNVKSLRFGIAQPHGSGIFTRFFASLWMTIKTWMEANTMRQGYMG